MSIFSQHSRSGKRPRGFTLIELMVVMAIMVILTTVLLLRQSRFDSSTLLRSLAYSVALSVRQAQVYGTSVFGTTTTQTACGTNTYQSGACFAQGYGIHVDWVAGGPTSYILFADLNNDGTYEQGEDVKAFSLGKGYAISNICATTTGVGGTQYCVSGGITSLSILYRRPNPEACITTNDPSSLGWATACAPGASAKFATSSIQIQSTSGDVGATRRIYINSTGLISVGGLGT